MAKKETILDMIGQVFKIYGFTAVCITVFCVLFGEDASQMSSMFALGDAGITISTLLQFLGLTVWIVLVRALFFTDVLIKKMSLGMRIVGMFIMVIAAVVICAYCFNWFPVNEVKPWIAFYICFGICASVSVIISILKEKKENEMMKQALERLKQEEQ